MNIDGILPSTEQASPATVAAGRRPSTFRWFFMTQSPQPDFLEDLFLGIRKFEKL